MPHGVGTGIAVARGIRRAADADGIEDDEQRACHPQAVTSSAVVAASSSNAAANRVRVYSVFGEPKI